MDSVTALGADAWIGRASDRFRAMALKDSESGTRSGTDVLLQEIPHGVTAYRMVQNDPPTEDDFRSYYELRKIPTLLRPFRTFEVFGVSTYLRQAKAERIMQSAHRRREPAWVAELDPSGLWGVYKAKTTHLEVFGLPADLVARVSKIL
jgi:hypothetical protein